MKLSEFLSEPRKPLDITIGEPVHDVEIASFFVTTLTHALQKSVSEPRDAGLSAE